MTGLNEQWKRDWLAAALKVDVSEAWEDANTRRMALGMLRHNQGYKARLMAKNLGVSIFVYQRIELGRVPLSRELFEKAVGFLDLTPERVDVVLRLTHKLLADLEDVTQDPEGAGEALVAAATRGLGSKPCAPPWGLRLVRRVRHLSRGELAAATALPVELIADYERARQPLPEETLLAAITALRFTPQELESLDRSIPRFEPQEWWSNPNELPPPWLAIVDEVMSVVTERVRQVGYEQTRKGASPEEVRAAMKRESDRLVDFGNQLRLVKEMTLQAELRKKVRSPSPEDREKGAELWSRIEREPHGRSVLGFIVKHAKEYRHWALCERMGREGLELLEKSPEKALEMAELTVELAKKIQGEPAWRRRLRGFAWACLSNAHLAQGNRARAEEALARARRLWDAGEASGTDILDETPLRMAHASLLFAGEAE